MNSLKLTAKCSLIINYLKKLEMAKQKQPLDKSTVYDGSTENPQDHPDFYDNVPHDYLPAVKALSIILLAGIALLSAKYNSWKPSWEEHDWEILKYSFILFTFLWSGILAAECVFILVKKWWSKVFKAAGISLFTASFIVLGIHIIVWIINKLMG